jgi:ABC-type glutathione transport system ATPase component
VTGPFAFAVVEEKQIPPLRYGMTNIVGWDAGCMGASIFAMQDVLISAKNLIKEYPRDGGVSRVMDDVSFDIERGETLGLVGESGSGKSTVARMILRLIEPTSGTVEFAGESILRAGTAEMRHLRRRMQIVFQDPYAALNPRMSVREIVGEPFLIHREQGTGNREQIAARVAELLREVGLDGSAMERYPHEFSGGQRQRINIARALALRPEFLVLDEPVSALDVSVGAQVINLLKDLQRARGMTYLFISHSMPLVRYLADRVAVLQRGRLVEIGDCAQVCEEPREAYTRQLIAATPEIAVR